MNSTQQQGDYQHISLSQVISTTKQRLRIESSDDDIFIERYANEGARHFDSLSTFIKAECDLEVVNGKAKLPYGFYQILDIGCCDDYGNEYFYCDLPFLTNCGVQVSDYQRSIHPTFQIQDGWIYVSAFNNFSNNHGVSSVGIGSSTNNCAPNLNATSVASGPPFNIKKIHLAYAGMNVDSNGMMTVYADMERGLVAYCVWMYMLDSPAGRYTNQQIEANHAIYVNQKKWYKSVQFQNYFRNNRRDIMSLATAYFTSKYTRI